jgi:subtilisin-like proprotein convertase family protein
VSVALTFNHTWVGDLQAVLIAPDGKQVPLFAA